MEGGLGSTRMGSRSSTRHGPASVFQGRVRRWKKSWAPVAPSSTPSAAACRVLLYKWSPITVPAANGMFSHMLVFFATFSCNVNNMTSCLYVSAG